MHLGKSFFLILLSLILLRPFDAAAQNQVNPFLRFLASRGPMRDQALYTLIAKRCTFYVHPGKVSECQNIVDQMLSLLDHDLVTPTEDSFLFVGFKTELREIMSDKTTLSFLQALNDKVALRISRADLSFNLWSSSRELFGSDRKAAKMLAILLQDTSIKKCHLAYLALTPNPSPELQANVEALSQLIDNLTLLAEYVGLDQSLFYPSQIGAKFNPGALYHFYMPYYLGLRLKYDTPLEFSYTAPLMLTLSYEFITTGEDTRYLFKDPETIENDWKVTDIYAGHSGVALAIGKPVVDFEELKQRFAQSTKNAVELLSY